MQLAITDSAISVESKSSGSHQIEIQSSEYCNQIENDDQASPSCFHSNTSDVLYNIYVCSIKVKVVCTYNKEESQSEQA